MLQTMTINQAVESFLKWKETHMDNPQAYRIALNSVMVAHGDRETSELDITHVTEIAEGLGNTFMFLTVLKIFARYCHWAKIPFISPHLIKVKRKYDPEDQRHLEEKDIETMCSVIPDDTFLGVRNQLIILMLFQTGCRISELLDLKLQDIDAQENSVKVLTKKSKIQRYVAWTMDTHRLLQTYLGMRISKNWKSDRLFINKDGRILTSRGVQYMFSKVSEESLGEKHHPHECRHGKARDILLNKNGDIYAVKTLLGHKNLESALTYMRLYAKESLSIVKRYI